MSLFQLGDFKLHSGAVSRWKIDCDYLTVADLRTLAFLAFQRLPPFGQVVGVPTGGLLFAATLAEYARPPGPWLLADDVLTTGASMETMRQRLDTFEGPVRGVVLFARGPCPSWVVPLFTLTPERVP